MRNANVVIIGRLNIFRNGKTLLLSERLRLHHKSFCMNYGWLQRRSLHASNLRFVKSLLLFCKAFLRCGQMFTIYSCHNMRIDKYLLFVLICSRWRRARQETATTTTDQNDDLHGNLFISYKIYFIGFSTDYNSRVIV